MHAPKKTIARLLTIVFLPIIASPAIHARLLIIAEPTSVAGLLTPVEPRLTLCGIDQTAMLRNSTGQRVKFFAGSSSKDCEVVDDFGFA